MCPLRPVRCARNFTIWVCVRIGQAGGHWLRFRWKFWRWGPGYLYVRSFKAGERCLRVGREFRRRSRWMPLISRAEVHRNYPFDALPEAIEMLKHPVASNFLGRFGTMYNHASVVSRYPLGCLSRRSRQSPVAVGEALPEEATSLGGSSVRAARPSTWWKQPGGSLTRPQQLNSRRRRTASPSGPSQNRPFCRGNSGTASVVYQF